MLFIIACYYMLHVIITHNLKDVLFRCICESAIWAGPGGDNLSLLQKGWGLCWDVLKGWGRPGIPSAGNLGASPCALSIMAIQSSKSRCCRRQRGEAAGLSRLSSGSWHSCTSAIFYRSKERRQTLPLNGVALCDCHFIALLKIK